MNRHLLWSVILSIAVVIAALVIYNKYILGRGR